MRISRQDVHHFAGSIFDNIEHICSLIICCIMKNPKRINRTLAAIVILLLLLCGLVAILSKIENSKYDARVESVHAQIQRALGSDPNYATIKVSVGTFSAPRGMLPVYRRTIGRIPALRQLGFLKAERPIKGIVIEAERPIDGIDLSAGGNGFEPGPFYDKVISPLKKGNIPVQIKMGAPR